MQFGRHIPVTTKDRGQQSPMAAFARGLQIPGTQWTFKFSNGYGASVINDGYGAESGLYELAVLSPEGHVDYSTPVTDDVLGWQSAEEVAAALDRIESLTPESILQAAVEKESRERDEKIAELRRQLADLEAEATR